jgi:YHS domain-containing protein
MKTMNYLSAVLMTASLFLAPLASRADEQPAKAGKVKPYTLETCPVSDEKLGEMGKPYEFEYKGREIKLCCKSCKKDFDKDPAKFVKKIDAAEKDAAAKAKK